MSGTRGNVNGSMTLDLSFAACNQGDIILNGSISMVLSTNRYDSTGYPDLINSTQISTSQNYNNLSMQFQGGESLTVDGTVNLDIDQSGLYPLYSMTMGMVMQDNVTGQTAKIENYHLVVTEYPSYDEINIVSARVYDFDFGYVDISTPTPLEDSGNSLYPEFGILRLQGAHGSSAVVDFSMTPEGSWDDGQGTSGTFSL